MVFAIGHIAQPLFGNRTVLNLVRRTHLVLNATPVQELAIRMLVHQVEQLCDVGACVVFWMVDEIHHDDFGKIHILVPIDPASPQQLLVFRPELPHQEVVNFMSVFAQTRDLRTLPDGTIHSRHLAVYILKKDSNCHIFTLCTNPFSTALYSASPVFPVNRARANRSQSKASQITSLPSESYSTRYP